MMIKQTLLSIFIILFYYIYYLIHMLKHMFLWLTSVTIIYLYYLTINNSIIYLWHLYILSLSTIYYLTSICFLPLVPHSNIRIPHPYRMTPARWMPLVVQCFTVRVMTDGLTSPSTSSSVPTEGLVWTCILIANRFTKL